MRHYFLRICKGAQYQYQSLVHVPGFIHHPEKRKNCTLLRQRVKWMALKCWMKRQFLLLFLESYFKNLNQQGLSK